MNDFDALLDKLTQREVSGGIHTPPELRLLLCCLARLMRAENVLETGYDAGFTTLALGMSGAKVTAVDNLSQYGFVDPLAYIINAGNNNVELRTAEALEFLKSLEDESVDMAFIDDWHFHEHVGKEAQELIRVLRPGGVAVFHDVRAEELELWDTIIKVVPDWQRINLPASSPVAHRDFGFALLRKPNGRF